jgi:hypothetical protein
MSCLYQGLLLVRFEVPATVATAESSCVLKRTLRGITYTLEGKSTEGEAMSRAQEKGLSCRGSQPVQASGFM